ncbi:hypothetical protein C0J52_06029 [Blattella germanica]|nr:hypothetical protein C0J52_06029 [Blattella germanica]
MTDGTSDRIDWKSVDISSESLPENIKTDDIVIETGKKHIEGIEVFYRKASPPSGVKSTGQSLLLLHGRNFKSETWENLGTLNVVAALGHLVVAIDLPGYGETKETYNGDRSKFLLSVLKTNLLNHTRPVLVSPSMSGEYAVKFVGEHSDLLSGYIPVAPVATSSVSQDALKTIKLPTLILVGEKDTTPMAKDAPKNLRVMPNSREIIFKNAGHAAYLDKPEEYHKLLHNFMLLLKQ